MASRVGRRTLINNDACMPAKFQLIANDPNDELIDAIKFQGQKVCTCHQGRAIVYHKVPSLLIRRAKTVGISRFVDN